jgi:guanine nucleotide-binding protein subunit alpha
MFQPNAFTSHRRAWRAVIHLNLIKSVVPIFTPFTSLSQPSSIFSSVRYILDTLQDEEDEEAAASYSRHRPTSSLTTASAPLPYNPTISTDSTNSTTTIRGPAIPLGSEHKRMRMRLSPLLRVGDTLGVKLSPEYYDPNASSAAKYSSSHATSYSYVKPGARDLTVRSGSAWKSAFAKMQTAQATRNLTSSSAEDEAARVLNACAEDIWSLWTDPIVKEVLKKRRVRLEEMSGLCVSSFDRLSYQD